MKFDLHCGVLRHLTLAGLLLGVMALSSLRPAAAAAAAAEGTDTGSGTGLCPYGITADLMLGAYHIHPDRKFDDFDPGIGIGCGVKGEWAATAGYFRNSVWRPSFYGGVVYTPERLHWDWFRVGLLGGVISGYNFGSVGFGSKDRTGFILVPSAIVGRGRWSANFILVPPIPADHVPLTVGLQVKYRIR